MNDDINGIPVDDGSDKPLGSTSQDGELEVREQPEGGQCYYETDLGQHMRWMRQAPDLYDKYQMMLDAVTQIREMRKHACPSCDLGDDERAERDGWNSALAAVEQLLTARK